MSLNINPYSLWEIMVASTNADASAYGDPVELAKDQMLTITPVHDTDQQRDSGQVTSLLSVGTHAELAIQAGGIPLEAFVAMAGYGSSTSGTVVTLTPRGAGSNMPYFGVIGVAPTEDDRFLVVGLYKVQLQAVPEINLDGTGNAWVTSEMSALAAAKASVKQYMKPKIFDTLTDWETAKPSDGTEFLAFFS